MSTEHNVFLSRAKMATPEEWRSAILQHGFGLEMETDFDLDLYEGFIPCKYHEKETGFEFYSEDSNLEELFAEELITTEERERLGDRYYLVTLVSDPESRSYVAAAIAAAVLCELSDGFLAPGGETPFIGPKEAVAWAKKSEPMLLEEIEWQKEERARGE